MIFGATKSIPAKRFSLKELSAAPTHRRPAGLNLWQKITLAALAGILLALSTPGFDQWWLAWFMLAPFLVLLSQCKSHSQSLLCGLFFGLGYHLIALRFYLNVHAHTAGQISLLIWLMQAILLSLPAVAFAWFVYALPLRPGYIPYWQRPFFPYLIAVPLLWIFLHRGLTIAHPLAAVSKLAPLPAIAIDNLAYSQYSQLAVIQLAKLLGPCAIEFLLLLVNAAIASFLIELVNVPDRPVERVDAISPRLGAIVDLAIALGLAGLNCILGIAVIMHTSFLDSDLVTKGLVSKDFLRNEINMPKIPVAVVSSDEATVPSAAASSELMVLPQPRQEITLAQSSNYLNLLSKSTAENHNSALLSFLYQTRENTIRQDCVCSSAGIARTERPLSNANEYSFLSAEALPAAIKEWFFLTDESGSPYQTLTTIAKINWGKVAILGGSEINNSQLVANDVRHGASIIICTTNIDWADKSLAKQLLAAAILRAVENKRYVILAAGNTLMSVIEPTGLVRSLYLAPAHGNQSEIEKSGIILSTVQFLWLKTPFTKMWWL